METYLAIGHCIAGYEELRIDVVQIPFEALAAQIVAKGIGIIYM